MGCAGAFPCSTETHVGTGKNYRGAAEATAGAEETVSTSPAASICERASISIPAPICAPGAAVRAQQKRMLEQDKIIEELQRQQQEQKKLFQLLQPLQSASKRPSAYQLQSALQVQQFDPNRPPQQGAAGPPPESTEKVRNNIFLKVVCSQNCTAEVQDRMPSCRLSDSFRKVSCFQV